MSDILIAFKSGQRIARGPLAEITASILAAAAGDAAAVIVLNAETSAPVDVATQAFSAERSAPSPGPGRPKLGVTSREVSLLPRHWEWLAQEPGGASATLRRLVEQARRSDDPKARKRQTTEAVHRFMHVMAGDLPNFEEASRAFYQDRPETVARLIADWPADIRTHLQELLHTHWQAP